jgi:hypothetical protein
VDLLYFARAIEWEPWQSVGDSSPDYSAEDAFSQACSETAATTERRPLSAVPVPLSPRSFRPAEWSRVILETRAD